MSRRMMSAVLVPGIVTLALAGTVLAAPGGGGSHSEKPATTPASTDQPMTPEEKAQAAKAAALDLYDKGSQEVDQAAEEVEQALKLESETEPNSLKEAKKLHESVAKHYKKAIEKFGKATQLVPDYYEGWNMLGYSYRKSGQIGNAFKAYDTCLKLKPDYEPAHEYLGEAHLIAGNLDKAKAELKWLQDRKSDLAGRLEKAIQQHEEGKTGASSGSGW